MAFSTKRQRPKFKKFTLARRASTHRGSTRDEEIRIVLIGKTGNGKSASGNTLLNRDAFASDLSPNSVTSECNKARGTVHGQRIAVIDTPGIFDTKYKEWEVVQKQKICISLSAPGPHAFLVVIKLDRFTEEEQKSVELIQQVFGDRAADFSLVLFTNGDQLGNTTIESFTRQSTRLTSLIRKCNDRYHVFNNKDRSCSQVPQLLEKIERMVKNNGGSFYTNQMFQEAERAIQESIQKILKANAEEKRQHEQALMAKLRGEELQSMLKELNAKYQIQAREKAEKNNRYIFRDLVVAAAEVGLAVGAGAGAACGPLGVGLGAMVGGLIGATLGLVAPAAVVAIRNHCVTQ